MPVTAGVLVLGLLLTAACSGGLPAPPEAGSLDSHQDHLTLASMHSREALRFRQKAEEQANRIVVYERLFGRDSDWVSGAHLLAEYYEEAAREQDRQATLHLELARRRSAEP